MEIINLFNINNIELSDDEKQLIIMNAEYLIDINKKIQSKIFAFKIKNYLLCVIGDLCRIHKNYNKMLYYYNIAIDKDATRVRAMYKLGNYYNKIERNYTEAIKYYKMASCRGDSDAMNELGYYYDDNMRKYEEAVKYYLMAIENGNSNAMCNLGKHYYYMKNYSEAIKYLQMAIEKGNVEAMDRLGHYYEEIRNYPEAIKYFKMAIDNRNLDSIFFIESIFRHNIDIFVNFLLSNDYNPENEKLCFIKEHLIKDNFECPVCYETFDYSIKTGCNHHYCYECYSKIDTCAMCRRDISHYIEEDYAHHFAEEQANI